MGITHCFQEVEILIVVTVLILIEDWENGYGLFRFDSTPAGSRHPNYLVPRRSGNVNRYLNFHTPTPAVIN